jgi:glycosyltransferase involved in cell wall biosynthesis
MKVNLILCTIGREKEIENFLISLENQTYKNYTLIIVDQNKDNKVYNIVQKYTHRIRAIKYFKVKFKGLSKARNFGLKQLGKDADIIAFPDDDCAYPTNLLENVVKFFKKNPQYSILTGISIDKETNLPSSGRFLKNASEITFSNIFQTAISFTIFIRKNQVLSTVKFDERLGVGTNKYCSGEETDFLLQLIESGLKGFYYPGKIYVFHPNKLLKCNEEVIKRNYKYSLGMGAIFKKHLVERKQFKLIIPFFSLFLLDQ